MNKNLKDEIDGYCKANKIKDVEKFIEKLIRQGFTIEKYGMTPEITPTKPQPVPSNQTNIIDQIAEIEKEEVKVKKEKIIKKADTDLYGE